MTGFFEELQRRKVYRVAAGYIIAGGFIIQMVSAAFPAWERPNWSQRLVIALILAGFPIALIFAWIFDVTPSGSARRSKIEAQGQPKARRRGNVSLLVLAALARP